MVRNKKIGIFENTLREGSYVVDNQFTAEDTYIICLALARAGFKYIEIGHGVGMGSVDTRKGSAAATDMEYLDAAKAALKSSDTKCGMFFIPGIGSFNDLKLAAQHGMDFVRIGTNVSEIAKAEACFKQAKDLGFMVTSNLMKSYAVNVDEFRACAKKASNFGADLICVVDSAGGMLPDDVKGYVKAIRDVTSKDIGFHGHNNLHMAMANSLAAIDAGATFIDSSLQGMGRSAGNAQTEVLVMLLDKLGYHTGINFFETMDIGQRIVRTMMPKEQGIDQISLVQGVAQFHSSFLNFVDEAAQKYRVDLRQLILEVSKIDRVNVTRELAEKTAKALARVKRQKDVKSQKILIRREIFLRNVFNTVEKRLDALLKEAIGLSLKTGKESVFLLTVSKAAKDTLPFIRQSPSSVIVSIAAQGAKEAEAFAAKLDGQVNWIILDESCSVVKSSAVEKKIKKSRIAWYSKDRVMLLGLCAFLSQKSLKGRVLVFGDESFVNLFLMLLKQQGLDGVFIPKEGGDLFRKQLQSATDICAIVSFGEEFCPFLNKKTANFIKENILIYSASSKAFPKDFWEAVLRRGMDVYRVDPRAAFASEVILAIETARTIEVMGARMLGNVEIVSGGVIGKRGSITIDSITSPTRVIGVCDGRGGLLPAKDEAPFRKDMEKIKSAIIEKLYF